MGALGMVFSVSEEAVMEVDSVEGSSSINGSVSVFVTLSVDVSKVCECC